MKLLSHQNRLEFYQRMSRIYLGNFTKNVSNSVKNYRKFHQKNLEFL